MKCFKDDEMWIGQKQIIELMNCGIISEKRDIFIIALMHHSDKFLHSYELYEYNERSATYSLLLKNVDLTLCGHTETEGRPIFSKLVDRGKILNGGAVYFSDEHHNSFSIITIDCSNKKTDVTTYQYLEKWGKLNNDENNQKINNNKVSYFEPVHEYKRAIIGFDVEDSRKILMESNLLVKEYVEKSGDKVYEITNKKDILAKLSIICKFKIGGSVDVSLKAPNKYKVNAEALLEKEKKLKMIYEINQINYDNKKFWIEDSSGKLFFECSIRNVNVEYSDELISIYETLVNTQNKYNVVFEVPKQFSEAERDKFSKIKFFIENEYFKTELKNEKFTCSCCSLEIFKKIYEIFNKYKYAYLIFDKKLYCEFLGANILLGSGITFLGEVMVDLSDIDSKISTYQEEDSRRITFVPSQENSIYFFLVGMLW